MHIETLRIFCDVVELNSLSMTAGKHLISQSAVSQQLAQLEQVFKGRLMDRQTRPFRLTSEGELFYQAARDVIARYEKLGDDLAAMRKKAAGRVNVAAIYSIGMHTLPPYVKRFMAACPDANVHVEYLGYRQICEQVCKGVVDIGLIAVPGSCRNLKVYDFMQEELVLVCSPEHRLAEMRTVSIASLQNESFISFEEGIPSRDLVDNILRKRQVTVRTVMEFDNIETVKRATEIDAGVSILPETAVRQEVASGTLRAIPFHDGVFNRPTAAIVRKGGTLGRPAADFLEMLCGD